MASYRQCWLSIGAVASIGCLEDCIKRLLGSISYFLIQYISFEGIWLTSVMCKVSASIQPFMRLQTVTQGCVAGRPGLQQASWRLAFDT